MLINLKDALCCYSVHDKLIVEVQIILKNTLKQCAVRKAFLKYHLWEFFFIVELIVD